MWLALRDRHRAALDRWPRAMRCVWQHRPAVHACACAHALTRRRCLLARAVPHAIPHAAGRGFWNLLTLHPCLSADGTAPFYLGVTFELPRAALETVLVEMTRYRQRLAAQQAHGAAGRGGGGGGPQMLTAART